MALQQVGAEQANYWMAFPMSSSTRMDIVSSPKVKGANTSASVDDAPVKVRKPYTITKQRERWTEDEHQKFLEALKLHGRAWRRIEDHIGTKTAVQIRSHAQKFFSKLEREASLGGSLATSGSGEIEIPPPRPKRKPSHPYPKKASGALSNSPSLEEDSKSPPAVCSAFTPLENCSGTTNSTFPPKKVGSSAASLRLFGQTVVQGVEKTEADNDLMESTGSPRSQVSDGTDETSGISPIATNTVSAAWDQSASISKLNESAITETKSQLYYGCTEWEENLIALHAPHIVGGHHLAHHIPAFWQGFVPPSFFHATNDDSNAAAAIAAATFAVASAWQAIHGALISNAINDTNTSTVYSPIPILAAAGKPLSVSVPSSPSCERLQGGGRHHDSGDESEGTNIQHEDSTAECCCSSLTESSRLSSYESNDERAPAKKRQRKVCEDDKMLLHNGSPEALESITSERILKPDTICLYSEDFDNSQMFTGNVDENNNTGQSFPDELMQPVNNNLQTRVISKDAERPMNSVTQACGFSLSTEFDENSSKASGAEGFLFRDFSRVNGVQCGANSESGEHLFMFKKAGATLSSRYSGIGFVPYRKVTTEDSPCKHEHR